MTPNTSELVKRLRERDREALAVGGDCLIAKQAADAIERLEAERDSAQARNLKLVHQASEWDSALAAADYAHEQLELVIKRVEEWNLSARDEIANLKALLPYHEYKGQDK